MSRGDVVVRVRQIAEDRAVAEVAMANHAAAAARDAAAEARLRARTHPLAGSSQALRGNDLHAAHVAAARQVADSPGAARKAAEGLADRRREGGEAGVARRDQRSLDEAALATRYLR